MDRLSDDERWRLLQLHLNKPICGRTELAKQKFIDQGLAAMADWNPERHVNIVGWPDVEEERKVIAQALYASQLFIPLPGSP
jgi:hypothetical protein